MSLKAALLVDLAFLALAAAQPANEGTQHRVLHFTSTRAEPAVKEMSTVIRAIADIRQFSIDAPENALILEGTAAQIALAEWLFPLLDQPIPADPAKHEFRISVHPDESVRVFYLANAATVQDFQEIATSVRSVADIRALFTYNAPRAIVIRGTADQIALADFLLSELDKPPTGPSSAVQIRSSAIYTYPPHSREGVLKVFFLPFTATTNDFQQINLVIRTVTEARRLFTYNALRAVILRERPTRLHLPIGCFTN